MENIKQIPYGVADFVSVMEQNLYYVDKTMFLPIMEEQPRFLFFIRPRRFGKSLFINMMRAYYDKAMTDQFDSLFGSLYIGQHPTPLRGRYQVLYLDFSQIGGSISQLDGRFDEYCSIQLNQFVRKYNDDYPSYFADEFFALNNSASKLNMLTSQAKELSLPLYLIIDEYDNFTNVV
ncbi:MAG: AAA family ATPase, partial [Bacteroidaceae bacterium]